jgi:hypothetical protein
MFTKPMRMEFFYGKDLKLVGMTRTDLEAFNNEWKRKNTGGPHWKHFDSDYKEKFLINNVNGIKIKT